MKKTIQTFCALLLTAVFIAAMMPTLVSAEGQGHEYKITELTEGQKLTSADSVTSETTQRIFIFLTKEEAEAATGGDGFWFNGTVYSFSPFVPNPVYFLEMYNIGFSSIIFVKRLSNGDAIFHLSDQKDSPLSSYPTAASLTYTGENQDLIATPAEKKDPTVKVYYSANGGATWSESIPQGTVSRYYYLYMKVDAGNTGYSDVPMIAAGAAYISPRPVTVSSADASKHVGENDPALSYTVVSGSVVEGETLDLTLSREAGEAPGRYNIDILNGKNSNYNVTVSDEKGVFTITAHEWSYSAEANVITANCDVEGCRYHDGNALSLELSVPQNAVYRGSAFSAAVNDNISEATGNKPGAVVYKDKNGKTVTQVKIPGTYTAEVTLGGATASNTFTVAKAKQVLTADSLELQVGELGKTLAYSLEGIENGAECGKVTFTVISGGDVISIGEDGTVSGQKAGTAEVKITAAENAYYSKAEATVTVTVKAVPVTGIVLETTELTLKSAESAELTASVLPENATDKSVVWESSDTTVAVVSADGKVTAVKAGTATITATAADGGMTATCLVTVEAPAQKRELTEGNGQSREKGAETSMRFRFGDSSDDPIAIEVDGKALSADDYEIDPETSSVNLKADYLKTLEAGSHTLTVKWSDGSADADFSITDVTDTVPTSSLKIGLIIAAAVLVCGLIIFGALLLKKRKK